MLTPIPNPANLAHLALYTDMHLPLSVLFQHISEAGKSVIESKVFTRCTITGPAVFLAVGGVEFQGCNMGPNGGDVRNLLLKPVAPKQVIGVIPVMNCRFVDCQFHAVGFTGNDEFIDVFLKGLGEPSLAELNAR